MKTRVVHIRVEKEVYGRWVLAAQRKGVKVSEYIRGLVGEKEQRKVGRPVVELEVVPFED